MEQAQDPPPQFVGSPVVLNSNALTALLDEHISTRQGPDKPLAYLGVQMVEMTKTMAAFGIPARDCLIQAITGSLNEVLPDDAVLFRVQTNTFGIVLPNTDFNKTPKVVRTIERVFHEPFVINNVPIFIDVAIGVAVYPHHATDALSLRQAAAAAIIDAQSKAERFSIYDPAVHKKQTDGLALVSELRGAIESQQMELWYQPKVGLGEGRLIGAEALIRWRHPNRGLIGPGQFIEFAEHTGLMTDVTTWVLRAAAEDLTKSDKADQTISVNLSARDLLDPGLEDLITNLLHYYRIDPERFEIEVTESALVINPTRAIRALRDLRKLGVGIAIDDFGAGYASLRYLAEFPVTVVKIDLRFARTLCSDPKCQKIVDAIIGLCHGLDLKVVAEGVENEDACLWLRDHECDAIQGYYIARPMPKNEYDAWAAEYRETSIIPSRPASPPLRLV